MKYSFSIILAFLCVSHIFSQKSNLPGKLPWVNGNLPSNSINYNYKVVQGDGSSLSDASDFSDDSFYSGSRISRPSDDGSCTSPESDIADPFQFPVLSKLVFYPVYKTKPFNTNLIFFI